MLISKMGVKMNLRLITKNHEVDPEIGFLIKSILNTYGRAAAMPTAWELKNYLKEYSQRNIERLECQLEEERTKSEIAKKNFEELYKKYKGETESLRTDLLAQVSENDNKEIQLKVFISSKSIKPNVVFMIIFGKTHHNF